MKHLMHRKTGKRLGELLIEQKIIDSWQLDKALTIQNDNGRRVLIGKIISEAGFAKEEDVIAAFITQYNFPYLPIKNYRLNLDIIKMIPDKVIRRHRVIPLNKTGDIFSIAMVNPLDKKAIEEVANICQCPIRIFLSSPSDIDEAIKSNFDYDESLDSNKKLGLIQYLNWLE